MALPVRVYLVAAGHAHPARPLTSAHLEQVIPDLPQGWSEKYLGMTSRRVLGVEERAVDLAIQAVASALDDVNWNGEDVDAFICGTTFPDQVVPAAASYIACAHHAEAVAFDVTAACSSFLYALSTAVGLLATSDSFRRIAVCAAEHPTAYCDYTDRTSSVFWGDSAAAVLVTTMNPPDACFELVDLELNGDHEFPEKVSVPLGGPFRSDGRYSYAQVQRMSASASNAVIERNGVDRSRIAATVFHQSSRRMVEDLSRTLEIPAERQWHNFEWAGNQSAAGVATAFSKGWADTKGSLSDGDYVLLTVVGGGYNGAAALLRWRSSMTPQS